MLEERRVHVLFVDSPDAIGLFKSWLPTQAECSQWDVQYSSSPNEALSLLELEGPYDLVVADLDLQISERSSLLSIIKSKYPKTVRVGIAHSESDKTLRNLPVAHQILRSPIACDELIDAVERGFALQDRLHDNGLREMLNELDTLPSPPLSVAMLNRELAKPETSIEDVATIISRDPAMTAKLLQLVNSAYFGLSHRITNVHQGVSYLGLDTVRNLLTAVELVRAFTPPSLELMKAVEDLHAHSLAVAEHARELMGRSHGSHDAFAAGMMHDVGMMAIISLAPEKYVLLNDMISASGLSFSECEQEILGTSHAQVGGYLLSLWGLPNSLVEAVARSHDADTIASPTMSPVHAVFVAEQIVNVLSRTPMGWEVGRLPSHEYLMELGIEDKVQHAMSGMANVYSRS